MEEHCKYEGKIQEMATEIENLKRWEESQNGSIYRVEQKIDTLIRYFMKASVGIILTLFVNVIMYLMYFNGGG